MVVALTHTRVSQDAVSLPLVEPDRRWCALGNATYPHGVEARCPVADRYIDRDSIPLVGVRIDHHDFGGADLDPTSYTVTIAVKLEGTRPVSADFKPATWTTDTEGQYWAQLQVGTGSAVGALTAGARYKVHAKVAASGETPVITSLDTIVVR